MTRRKFIKRSLQVVGGFLAAPFALKSEKKPHKINKVKPVVSEWVAPPLRPAHNILHLFNDENKEVNKWWNEEAFKRMYPEGELKQHLYVNGIIK